MSPRFGEVRALLHERADERSWELLCELLDGVAPDEVRDVYVPYLQAHLERWPDVHRVAPWRWLEGALARDRVSAAKMEIVKVVDLSLRRLRRDQLKRLLGLKMWSGVTHLYLESCRLSPASLELLVHHEALAGLRVLSLSRNPLSRDGAAVLAAASAFHGLKSLDLEACFLDDKGLSGVLDSACFARLEHLDLSANVLGVEAMETLSVCPQREVVRELNLTGCVAPQGARLARGGPLLDVLTSPDKPWPMLHQLELGHWGLEARSVRSLNRTMCASLRLLDLNGSALLRVGAERLAECEALEHVEVLDLGRNRIGDDGAQALIAPVTQLRALRQVILSWNGVTAAMRSRFDAVGCELVL